MLSGADLAVTENARLWRVLRVLTVEAVYSSGEGSDLPLKAATSFYVERLVANHFTLVVADGNLGITADSLTVTESES